MKKLAMTRAVRMALAEEMRRDEDVFLIGEDLTTGTFGVTSGMVDEFGTERIRDTPIAEAGLVGAAMGAAIAGARPVAEIMFASMVYMAADQLLNQIAKFHFMTGGELRVPVTIRTAVAMGVSAGAQHSDTPHSMFMHSPGFKVVCPGGARDARGLLKTAIRDDDPVIVFEHLGLNSTREEVPDEEELIPFGQANIRRTGDDLTIVAIGGAVPRAMAAAERLAADDFSAEVIDPRTLVPFDWNTVTESVGRTGRLVVVDDATPLCSVASEVAATVGGACFSDLRAPIQRVNRANTHVPFSPELEKRVLIDVDQIVDSARTALSDRARV